MSDKPKTNVLTHEEMRDMMFYVSVNQKGKTIESLASEGKYGGNVIAMREMYKKGKLIFERTQKNKKEDDHYHDDDDDDEDGEDDDGLERDQLQRQKLGEIASLENLLKEKRKQLAVLRAPERSKRSVSLESCQEERARLSATVETIAENISDVRETARIESGKPAEKDNKTVLVVDDKKKKQVLGVSTGMQLVKMSEQEISQRKRKALQEDTLKIAQQKSGISDHVVSIKQRIAAAPVTTVVPVGTVVTERKKVNEKIPTQQSCSGHATTPTAFSLATSVTPGASSVKTGLSDGSILPSSSSSSGKPVSVYAPKVHVMQDPQAKPKDVLDAMMTAMVRTTARVAPKNDGSRKPLLSGKTAITTTTTVEPYGIRTGVLSSETPDFRIKTGVALDSPIVLEHYRRKIEATMHTIKTPLQPLLADKNNMSVRLSVVRECARIIVSDFLKNGTFLSEREGSKLNSAEVRGHMKSMACYARDLNAKSMLKRVGAELVEETLSNLKRLFECMMFVSSYVPAGYQEKDARRVSSQLAMVVSRHFTFEDGMSLYDHMEKLGGLVSGAKANLAEKVKGVYVEATNGVSAKTRSEQMKNLTNSRAESHCHSINMALYDCSIKKRVSPVYDRTDFEALRDELYDYSDVNANNGASPKNSDVWNMLVVTDLETPKVVDFSLAYRVFPINRGTATCVGGCEETEHVALVGKYYCRDGLENPGFWYRILLYAILHHSAYGEVTKVFGLTNKPDAITMTTKTNTTTPVKQTNLDGLIGSIWDKFMCQRDEYVSFQKTTDSRDMESFPYNVTFSYNSVAMMTSFDAFGSQLLSCGGVVPSPSANQNDASYSPMTWREYEKMAAMEKYREEFPVSAVENDAELLLYKARLRTQRYLRELFGLLAGALDNTQKLNPTFYHDMRREMANDIVNCFMLKNPVFYEALEIVSPTTDIGVRQQTRSSIDDFMACLEVPSVEECVSCVVPLQLVDVFRDFLLVLPHYPKNMSVVELDGLARFLVNRILGSVRIPGKSSLTEMGVKSFGVGMNASNFSSIREMSEIIQSKYANNKAELETYMRETQLPRVNHVLEMAMSRERIGFATPGEIKKLDDMYGKRGSLKWYSVLVLRDMGMADGIKTAIAYYSYDMWSWGNTTVDDGARMVKVEHMWFPMETERRMTAEKSRDSRTNTGPYVHASTDLQKLLFVLVSSEYSRNKNGGCYTGFSLDDREQPSITASIVQAFTEMHCAVNNRERMAGSILGKMGLRRCSVETGDVTPSSKRDRTGEERNTTAVTVLGDAGEISQTSLLGKKMDAMTTRYGEVNMDDESRSKTGSEGCPEVRIVANATWSLEIGDVMRERRLAWMKRMGETGLLLSQISKKY